MDLNDLKKPFDKVKYFPKLCRNNSILLLAYLDSRQVQQRLDDVCGIDGWQCDYKEVKGNLYAGISILVNDPKKKN